MGAALDVPAPSPWAFPWVDASHPVPPGNSRWAKSGQEPSPSPFGPQATGASVPALGRGAAGHLRGSAEERPQEFGVPLPWGSPREGTACPETGTARTAVISSHNVAMEGAAPRNPEPPRRGKVHPKVTTKEPTRV